MIFKIYWLCKTHPHLNAASIKLKSILLKWDLQFKNPLWNFALCSILKWSSSKKVFLKLDIGNRSRRMLREVSMKHLRRLPEKPQSQMLLGKKTITPFATVAQSIANGKYLIVIVHKLRIFRILMRFLKQKKNNNSTQLEICFYARRREELLTHRKQIKWHSTRIRAKFDLYITLCLYIFLFFSFLDEAGGTFDVMTGNYVVIPNVGVRHYCVSRLSHSHFCCRVWTVNHDHTLNGKLQFLNFNLESQWSAEQSLYFRQILRAFADWMVECRCVSE